MFKKGNNVLQLKGDGIEIRGLKQKVSKANEQLPQRQRRELHAHHTAPKGQ